jgi:hypothetical protein
MLDKQNEIEYNVSRSMKGNQMFKHTEESALNKLRRNGVKINGTQKEITADMPGLKLISAIDYLTNHCGYIRWYKN